MTNHWTLGVDIGGTKIAAALIDAGGHPHGLHAIPTLAHEGAEAILERVITLARAVIAETSIMPVAVGVGTGGQVDPAAGEIVFATELLPGWTGLPLARRLREALGLPVYVANDVHAMALGEATYGAGRGVCYGLYVAVGTGIGGGWVLEGRLYHGRSGLAGSVGHVKVEPNGRPCTCGGRGCVEQYASGPAIAEHYRRLRGLAATPSGHEVVISMNAGDPLARLAIREAGRWLGLALASLVNAMGPDAIVVGGGVAAAGEPFFSAIRTSLAQHVLPSARSTPVIPAALGPHAGVIGAGVLARQGLSSSTLPRL
ncbi:MAG: ROK family protein [Anaerolineae bacterium]|nr:ROK family protein [Anaerolineae bacterium]MDW8098789.1 ROK family protein [Anaerolineae bacterium]